MRLLGPVAFVLFLSAAFACSGKSLVNECPSGGRTGTAPACILTAQCKSTNVGVTIDCSANDGNCVCSQNGVVGNTVPYQSAFCENGDAGDFPSLESSLEAANDACGWKL
jgi:hypothetical protein